MRIKLESSGVTSYRQGDLNRIASSSPQASTDRQTIFKTPTRNSLKGVLPVSPFTPNDDKKKLATVDDPPLPPFYRCTSPQPSKHTNQQTRKHTTSTQPA